MALYFTSINSGSNGNCYYIGTEQEAVLVDVGLSARETVIRMKRLGLKIEQVKAIFISHEHQDHIKGLSVLSNQYQIPVYMTEQTRKAARLKLERKRVFTFEAHQPIAVGKFTVTAFPKAHDAIDPYSFIVSGHEKTVGVFTDIGLPCTNTRNYFSKCHAVFLESNYDVGMLESGNYPKILKDRIRGRMGHLSNDEALEIFKQHRHDGLEYLMLAHLSKNNNHPTIVEQLFKAHANGVTVRVESRFEEMPLLKMDEVVPCEQLKLF